MVTPSPLEASDAPGEQMLRLAAARAGVRALATGESAHCVWSQGCSLLCSANCWAKDTWSESGGVLAQVEHVADWLVRTNVLNLILTGGEPVEQAIALSALVDLVREQRDIAVLLYSGFAHAAIARDVRPGAAALLARADVLIDGAYVQAKHEPLLGRGSSNQRIVDLTGRVPVPEVDEPLGLEVHVTDDGRVELVGIPSRHLVDGLVAALSPAAPPAGAFPFPVSVNTDNKET